MSDLLSLAIIGGFVLLLRKWGNYPEPAKQPHNRPPLGKGRPPVRSQYPRPRYDDDEDDD